MTEPEIVHVVAEAVDLLQPSIAMSNAVSDTAVELLKSQGYPVGLARELGNSKATYPLRFWIVDNSGSMITSDGRELTGSNKANLKVSECTRWKELQSTVEYHIGLANLIGAHTIFRLLNPPGNNMPQEFSIAEHGEESSESVINACLDIVRNTVPAGVTPLTEHLQTITARVQEIAPVLRQQSQKAVVVIATDGLPTDPQGNRNDQVRSEFIEALKTLQMQPVWIVIRLCTENDEVVDFYNELDKELESSLEVVDDFLGEATEVCQVNKWLKYVRRTKSIFSRLHAHIIVVMLCRFTDAERWAITTASSICWMREASTMTKCESLCSCSLVKHLPTRSLTGRNSFHMSMKSMRQQGKSGTAKQKDYLHGLTNAS